MNKKTTAKLDVTKAAAKPAESKVAAKVEDTKAVAKATVAETKVVASGVLAEAKQVVEDTKAVVEEKKTVAKKTKETAKKATTKTTKKAVKEELKPEVYIQYQGREAVVADAIEKAKEAYIADGHRVSSIKSLQVYLKPEEYAAYYVINKKFAGRVDLF